MNDQDEKERRKRVRENVNTERADGEWKERTTKRKFRSKMQQYEDATTVDRVQSEEAISQT